MAKTTKHLPRATCQICGGEQALENGVMHIHGYTRPGYGYLVGQCYGAGHEPYEMSCELIKTWIKELKRYQGRVERDLKSLQSGKVLSVTLSLPERGSYGKRSKSVLFNDQMTNEEVWQLSDGRFQSFSRIIESQIYAEESNLRMVKRDIQTQKERVDAWKLNAEGIKPAASTTKAEINRRGIDQLKRLAYARSQNKPFRLYGYSSRVQQLEANTWGDLVRTGYVTSHDKQTADLTEKGRTAIAGAP